LGATPSQVFIDGIPQLKSPHVVHKPQSSQHPPQVPNFDKEAAEAVEYDGLPPLEINVHKSNTLFTNVKSVFVRAGRDIISLFSAQEGKLGVVLVQNGTIFCSGFQSSSSCDSSLLSSGEVHVVDLKGGEISPGLLSFGSPLGLTTIEAEDSTNDGTVYDIFADHIPKILGSGTAMTMAVDGLSFGTRDAL
jgi:hypothetical protein